MFERLPFNNLLNRLVVKTYTATLVTDLQENQKRLSFLEKNVCLIFTMEIVNKTEDENNLNEINVTDLTNAEFADYNLYKYSTKYG